MCKWVFCNVQMRVSQCSNEGSVMCKLSNERPLIAMLGSRNNYLQHAILGNHNKGSTTWNVR